MSKPSQKQNSTSNTTGSSAFTGENRAYAPDWISNAVQGITRNIGTLGAADPHSYVAGSNDLLTQAQVGAQNLSGSPWNFDGAADLTRGVANKAAPDISSLMSKFMDPYNSQVVNATSADLDHSDNIARQQDTLSDPGAFGSSGIALTKSAMEDALSRGRATTLGGLRSQGFSQALGGATSQAQLLDAAQNRKLAAAGQLGDLSTAYDANQRANIGAQLGAGTAQRGVTQDQLSAPLNLAQWSSSTLPQLLSNFFGSNTSGTTNSTQNTVSSGSGSSNPGAASTAGDLAMIASLFMSDPRLKRDVMRLETRPDGLGLYLYRYIGKARWFIGVMADEVAKVYPAAVRTRPDGFLEVDYAALA